MRAASVQTKGDLDRISTLAQEHLATQQELELAQSNYDAAKASVEGAIANVAQARAQIKQKDAAVAIARTNVDHTVIRSPIDGIVVARNVDVGQTVAASLQAPTIFTIAQDLRKMQLYAKADESDVSRIRSGAPVTFKVDAFPKETFTGTVSQIRMNATTVQNVVTYDAIIDFDNPDLKIFPGMTAYVTVPVATVERALKVPNGALRYNPPLSASEIRTLYEKNGIHANEPDGPVSRNEPAAAQSASNPAGAPRPLHAESAVVWKLLADKTILPVQIALGLTDHAYTEVTHVIAGALSEGDELVTGSLTAGASGTPGAPVRR
jgi:HlyD family secretion protein